MGVQHSFDLGEDRRGGFRRFLVVSALLHVGLVAMLAFSPGMPQMDAPMGAISVDLVAAPMRAPTPPRAAPKAAPAPAKPVPPPKPKPPVPEKRVLPKETTTPKPTPRAKREEIPPEAVTRTETPERDYADVLDQLRSEAGEEKPAEPEPIAAVAPAGGGGTGRPVSPEVAEWMRRARIHIRRSWVVPPGFRQQSLATHVDIRLDAGGGVLGEPEIVKRSGNPWYDDGVMSSIRKASPLPAPPEAGVWNFVFVSDESY